MTLYHLTVCRQGFILEDSEDEKFNGEVSSYMSVRVLIIRVCRLIQEPDAQSHGNKEKWRSGQYGISK
jgi:hypothetical protein